MGKDLWYPYKIPVVVLAGEVGCGKTLWGLTVDEDVLDSDIDPPVITWDTEGSSDTYSALNFKRVDLIQRCVQQYGSKYTSQEMYLTWKKDVEGMQHGKYSLAMIDTATEIEEGLASYIKNHPGEFGYTAGQFAKAVPLMWGCVKAEYKKILMVLAAKVETLVINLHMRDGFKGGRPTNNRIPKGKETLREIASLYLILERKAPPGKKEIPELPSGICNPPNGKSRLVALDPSGILRPVLPPYLKDASPNGIRWYLNNPPDYNNLKPGERAVADITMSDDDRLSMQAGIASDQAARAAAELDAMQLKKDIHDEPRVSNTPTSILNRALIIKEKLLALLTVDQAKELMKSMFNGMKVAELSDIELTQLEVHINSVKN